MTSNRDEITPAVIEAIAEAEGVEPLDLSYSLNDYIDPDALEMLASRNGIEWRVQFRVEEYTVVIDGAGMISVRPDDRSVATENEARFQGRERRRRADPPIEVLHVDDDPAFGDLVKTFLERENSTLDVVTKTAASEGIEHLRRNSVDCVVSDYDMPGINGLEFLETVRDTHPDISFILFTGKGSEEIASKAISKGATDYLQKGNGTGQYEVLANRIRNNVDRYRTKHELEQSRQFLDRFLELSPTAVLILDRKGDIIRANEHAEDLLGIPREQLLTGACNDEDWQVVDADGNEIPDDALLFQRVLETGEPVYDVEHGIKQPDRKTVWHSVNAAPLWDTVASSGYVLAVLADESH